MSSPPSQSSTVSTPKESERTEYERNTAETSEWPIDLKVWNPPASNSTIGIRELPDSYFEPTATELKASYQAQVRAREALVSAPLKTQEMRDRETRSKLLKWPTTAIRIKFPDRTQLEKTFSSTDKIRSVYAFVRSSLREDVKPNKFVLYQTPPRRELKVSDLKVRDLSLLELQLAPSSVLHLAFLEESLNDVKLRAPLLESVLMQARDLPPPPKFDETLTQDGGKTGQGNSSSLSKDSGSKSAPKWFKIGQKR